MHCRLWRDISISPSRFEVIIKVDAFEVDGLNAESAITRGTT
jgi:hypothetical protein